MAEVRTTDPVARTAQGAGVAPHFSAAALVFGPLWAARVGLWITFFWALTVELVGLVTAATSLWPASADAGEVQPWGFAGGVVLIALARCGLGFIGPWLHARAARSDVTRLVPEAAALPIGAALMLFAYGLTLYRFLAAAPLESLVAFPAPNGLDNGTAHVIDVAVDWMKLAWVSFFDSLTAGLRAILNFIEALFVATPWPVVALAAVLLAWRLSGWRATVFAACGLAYLGLWGFWEKSMATMALIATSVVICVVVGIPIGVLCAKSKRTNAVLEPILDIMQTLPTFVYLIPAVAFFSIGKPPGVIATVIFSLPPMVRLTAHGIRHVPPHVREAADAFGASPAQMLMKVELPLAIPSIRLGINQTIMMCLSMVVVAAMIGAGGLGLDVMRSLQHLKTGQGFLAGIAIVVCAMVLDRVVRGRSEKRRQNRD